MPPLILTIALQGGTVLIRILHKKRLRRKVSLAQDLVVNSGGIRTLSQQPDLQTQALTGDLLLGVRSRTSCFGITWKLVRNAES